MQSLPIIINHKKSNLVCYQETYLLLKLIKNYIALHEKKMNKILIIFCFSMFQETLSTDTLAPDQSLHENQTLISNGQRFELGFFSIGKSKNKYLGIWYKTTPDVIVWVANRNIPLADSQGVLTLNKNGTLVLVNSFGGVIWSTPNKTSSATSSPVVKLLDNGNLVVQNVSDMDSGNYIWQSFDYPGNTRLPGMLMGENLENGQEIHITSWKSIDDPSPGDFVYKIEQVGLSQIEIVGNGTRKRFRSGPWNGICFNGLMMVGNQTFRGITDSSNRAKVFFITDPYNASEINRLILTPTGDVQRYVLNQKKNEWQYSFSLPGNPCDMYGQCGPNGICNLKQSPICRCMNGTHPRSDQEWKLQNWSSGCERSGSSSDCLHKGNDTFIKVSGTKLPDLLKFQMWNNMNLSECQAECLRNCSCTAYANPYINSPDSACLTWYGDLLDVKEYPEENNEQSFYARVPLSETGKIGSSSKKGKRSETIIIGVSTALGIFISFALSCVCIAIIRKRRLRKKEDLELPLFQFSTVASATKNFSSANLIGEGGFGPVYKGQLSTGQEVAVKRLSKNSGQGIEEFRNEVTLIAKLQHRNLVRLLGCCIKGEERMLIYEYMQNNSLDQFIFDPTTKTLLPWPKRFGSILGIARGLLYLHQDSRLRIIHRDLKTSNILLDMNLVPKISDFGLARIFGIDQDFAKTKRVIGTYGYMAPEYAIDGKFSVKSDVFSMGVLILEIVSGEKNRSFSHPDHHHTLLGHAWLLWNENRALEVMDSCLQDSYMEDQVKRCIQVGLLCVQKLVEDRPEMSSVVFMLSNKEANIPQPKEPGYFTERSSFHEETHPFRSEECNTDDMKTITDVEAR
ncbi:transmembrane signal receptor [Lithospermum erythrorhizon]|uniref:Receptor-like serine/threonine-protein kinase n=1 Tax=Lithospermum erythrorhizon TaxID=34254 RepID=A0AAV3PTB5_LITER